MIGNYSKGGFQGVGVCRSPFLTVWPARALWPLHLARLCTCLSHSPLRNACPFIYGHARSVFPAFCEVTRLAIGTLSRTLSRHPLASCTQTLNTTECCPQHVCGAIVRPGCCGDMRAFLTRRRHARLVLNQLLFNFNIQFSGVISWGISSGHPTAPGACFL